MKKHLGISGGGTKIAGLFGAAEVLLKEKGYKPDVISGISAGAILAVPLALGKFDKVKELVLNLTLDTFFSQKPVKENGSFTLGSIWRAITGKPYLGRQGNLEKMVQSVVSESEFLDYQNDPGKAVCIVGAVDFITGGRKYINLKDKAVSYAEFPRLVNASSSIPIFTNGIQTSIGGDLVYLFDGGVRDHIATAFVLGESEFKDQFDESVSIFSRPEDFKVLSEEFDDKNVISILSRYVDITNVEISKNDEFQIDDICQRKGIRSTKLFLPRVMKSTYDTDHGRLKEIYDKGAQEARDNYTPINAALASLFVTS
ncbi:MAG TPA: patatin-like phospholipase family protein [Ohtaekwangia sp.]|uniref:patatin-like phospholipase family protein n=1 Tax=Ohtaekwangia sp. TaxID=2066019 RepID=UPI002F933671